MSAISPFYRVRRLFTTMFFFHLVFISFAEASFEEKLQSSLAKGKIVYKLTTIEEFEGIFGAPTEKEHQEDDGGILLIHAKYFQPNASMLVCFIKFSTEFGSTPFVLYSIFLNGKPADINQGKMVVLRTEKDIEKFEPINGLQNVSLEKLDLRNHLEMIRKLSFDSRTVWPPCSRLPTGFNPDAILAAGKNPGLGIRELHGQGIDGRGVHIAIIDQPLLRTHSEYRKNLVRCFSIQTEGIEPQMHGPAVCGVAVGNTSGVAPGALLTFFETNLSGSNLPIIQALEKILEMNVKAKLQDRIRIISISTGMFPQFKHWEELQKVFEKVENQGILLFTCLSRDFPYGTLQRNWGSDPEDPKNYTLLAAHEKPLVLIPVGLRTLASEKGDAVFKFDPVGGMSWATPYLAGLSALALQVNPALDSATIKQLLAQTITQTDAGPVVNPRDFISRAKP